MMIQIFVWWLLYFLYRYCASTYERNKEMAAAALAYKCMGVTHMRIVASKTSGLTGDWHELHAAFQKAQLGNLANPLFFLFGTLFLQEYIIQK